MAKVSVLIAVYNAAPFLPQCLDSLIGQTHVDWQAVCVDDASTDTSLSVLQSYAQRDSRFEVIHLPQNVGLAKARNVALKRVDGDYVCMLDADDWLSSDAFQQAVDVFSQHAQTDCVLFRFVYTYQEADGYRYEEFKSHADAPVLSGAEACRLSLKWKIHGLYMVRASLQHRFPYDDTCRLFSDENTTRIHYAHSREIRFCDGYYYYRQHSQSETHRYSVRQFDKLRARESLIRQLDGTAIGSDVLNTLTNMLWMDVVDLYLFYYMHGKDLSASDSAYGLGEIHRVWQTIDRSQLNPSVTCKFGYRHMPTWKLFRLQEWLYFTLRGWMGKNR